MSADVFAAANLDVPFAVFYLVDEGSKRARRIAVCGLSSDAACPELVDLGALRSPWALDAAFRSGETVELDDVTARIAEPVGPYPELPRRALVLPIRRAGHTSLEALLVAGAPTGRSEQTGLRIERECALCNEDVPALGTQVALLA